MRKFIGDRVYRLLMTLLIAMAGLTTRETWINRHVIDAHREQGQGFIAGLWHNNLIYFTWPLGRLGFTGLISQSRDGENIARASAVFGLRPVRGSSARGTTAGLRGLLRALANGESAAITPDGPKGPRYVLQPGIVALARHAGVPIVPMAYAGWNMIQFNSWDRMKLPLPFSRIAVYVGAPIWIERHEKDEEAARLRVERAMREAEVIVDRFVEGGRVEEEPLLAEAAAESRSGAGRG